MGFSAPWMLAALAALGLPLWLHLLKKFKTPPQPFSSLMFFEQREQSSVRHRRLDYLLLFALRSLLFAALALAFAGPYLKGGAARLLTDQRLVVVAVDNSYSMRFGGRLEQAKAEASRFISRLGPQRKVQVMAFAGNVQLMGEPSADRSAQRGAIEAIRQEDTRGSLGDLARALRSLAHSTATGLEVHVFSDFQKTAMPAGFVELVLPPGTTLELHPVTNRQQPNWTVETVNAPRRLEGNQKGKVTAVVAGFGTPEATVKVSLLLRGRVQQTRTVTVPAGGRATVEFTNLDPPYGWSEAEVRIDAGDGFAEDDRFLFPVERSDPMPVLFVHEERDRRSPQYFGAALEAAAKSAFRLQTATPLQLGKQELDGFRAVVLSNVGTLPPGLEEALQRYVRQGGGLLIAVGASTAARGRLPVLADAVAESRYAAREGERFLTAGWFDSAHPCTARSGRWEGVRFYQVFPLAGGQGKVVVRTTDGVPLLVEREVDSGRVLVFASTLDNIANDFPLHASFVPFVDQTVRHLAGVEETGGWVYAGSFYDLRRRTSGGMAVEVLDPEGKRVLDLSEASQASGVSLDRVGFYQVRWGKQRSELVAVNADRRECNFELIPKETLELWRNTGSQAETGEAVAAGEQRIPLGWHFLLAAFLVAMAESGLAARYLVLKRREEAA